MSIISVGDEFHVQVVDTLHTAIVCIQPVRENLNGFSNSIVKLLKDEKLRDELGKNGQEHVKKNFLITRLISDWLDLFTKYLA